MTERENVSPISWLIRNGFRLLFPLTLPWIPLFLFANNLYTMVPEGSTLHNLIENLLVPISLLLSVLLSMVIYRIRPAFLVIPEKVSLRFFVFQTIYRTFLVFIALTVITLFISMLIDPPPWQSDNPQYIPLVFFAVVFYPVLLTPPVALIAIWRAFLQKSRKA